MSFLENLWEKNKALCIIVGLILFPITILLLGNKIMSAINMAGAKKSLENAQKKDDKLAAEEDALKQQANQSLDVANKAAQRIEDRKDEGLEDLDWHKKRDK